MSSYTVDNAAFDRGVDPILQYFTIEQAKKIVAFRGDHELQNRIETLARKANEGELTPEERAEYQGYVRANKFLAILQAKVQKLITTTSANG